MTKKRQPLAKIPPREWRLEEKGGGEEIARVQRLPKLPASLESLELPDNLKGRLTQFVGSLPGVAGAGAVAGGQVYACTFRNAGDFLHRKNGTISATITGPGGKILDQGTLISPVGVRVIAGVAAAWMAMSVVTGQHFLSDISERLRQIQQRLEEVFDYMKTKDRGKLRADAKALKDIYTAVTDRPATQGVTYDQLRAQLDQVMTIERDAAAVLDAQLESLEKTRVKISKWKAGGTALGDGPEDQQRKLSSMLNDYADAYSCACGAAYVRGLALTLAEMLPSDGHWVRTRAKDLSTCVAKLPVSLRDLGKNVESKIPQIDSFYIFMPEAKHRKKAQKQFETMLAELTRWETQSSEMGASLDRMLAEADPLVKDRMELVMRTDAGGQVAEVYRR